MSPAIDNRAMANIEREDHTALVLDVDDHPVVPDPEPEHPREWSRHRLQEVPRIVSPLDLLKLADHTLLDAAIELSQRLLGARSELNAPVRHLPLLLRCGFSGADRTQARDGRAVAAGGDLGEHLPLHVLALLADVEGLHGAEVAHDARPHLALDRLGARVQLGALGAGLVLPGQVAVDGADGEGGRDGDVGGAEGGQAPAHELLAGGGRGDPLVHVQVQDGAAGVLGLELLLHLLGLEGVVGVADGHLRRVRVVRIGLGAGLEDTGEAPAVLLGETVRGSLRRSRLEVVEVTGGLLELHHLVTHVIQDPHAHGVAARVGQIELVTGEVADHLVHAVDTESREVIIERAEPPLGEGEETGINVVLDNRALELQTVPPDGEQPVEGGGEPGLVAGVQVPQTRHIDGDDANAPGLLGGSEQAVAALEQFAQVELETAAHGTDHAGIQLGINEVLEVGQPVLRGHGEQAVAVLRLPVEVLGDVVRGDGEGEDSPLGVAGGHDLHEGAVDHRHLVGQVPVGEIAQLVADERVLVGEVGRAGPVEGEVGERRLGAPPGGDVEVEDELLHALENLVVGHRVQADEGRHVGVEGGEGLGAGPLVLEGAQEVDDLPDGGGEVPRRVAGDLAGDAVEALLEEVLERPAGAVAGEHVEVVDVEVAGAVGVARLLGVDLAQPVVGDDLPRGVENHPAQRVALIGVGVDPPVGAVQVLGDGGDGVDRGPRAVGDGGVGGAPRDELGVRGGEVRGGGDLTAV